MAVLEQSLGGSPPSLPRAAVDIAPGRLILSAFLSDTSGIGRGGRMSLEALRQAGLAPIPHDLRRAAEGWGRLEPGGVWFCHCNALEASEFLLRAHDPRACYRVGYWAWELPDIPPEWVEIARLFHEIWVPSRFVMEGLQRALGDRQIVLRRVPHPLPSVEDVRPDRARYGLTEEVFAFLCMYDVHSSATRKNPMGAVAAFQRAFRPDQRDTSPFSSRSFPAQDSRSCLDELIAATAGWPNIRLITDMLSDDDANRLICSADAFVSLHRSEGFGLSIAQAMAMGRPVIVTAWSGNMDFCGEGAALIGYTLIPASDPHGVYSAFEGPGQVWADPGSGRSRPGDAAARRRPSAGSGARRRGAAPRPKDPSERLRRLSAPAMDHVTSAADCLRSLPPRPEEIPLGDSPAVTPMVSCRNLTMRFPVYGLDARSLKKHLARLTIGGGLKTTPHSTVVTALANVNLELRPGDRLRFGRPQRLRKDHASCALWQALMNRTKAISKFAAACQPSWISAWDWIPPPRDMRIFACVPGSPGSPRPRSTG